MVDRCKGLRVQGSGLWQRLRHPPLRGTFPIGEGGPRQRRSGALVNCRFETHFLALFHTARTLSGSLRSPPSPRGEGFVRPYCFSTHACIRSDDARKAVFSFRSLPPLGKGDRATVDRVLSLMAYLRRSPSLFFTPPSPSNLRPFGAPPSIGRREYPRKPLPLEGAAERSEAGLASFFGGEAASSFIYIAYLRRISPLIFHTARTLSGSLRSPPSPRGEGFVRG